MQKSQRHSVNSFHGPKRQLLGTQGPPPAWKTSGGVTAANATGRKASTGQPSTPAQHSEGGSKILISRLPADVTDQEVRDLFNRTVGPTRDVFLIYNSKGGPKGMAIVTFQKAADAVLARTKYNGKIVDGKRPIKIELIVDEHTAPQPPTSPPSPLVPSLLDRMQIKPVKPASAATSEKRTQRAPAAATAGKPKPQPTKRQSRTRKGPTPARLKKKKSLSAKDLDREMEEYRAAGPPANNNFVFFPPKQDLLT